MVAEQAYRIQSIGWSAADADPRSRRPSGWPPDDESLTVPLDGADVAFVTSKLVEAQRIIEEIVEEDLTAPMQAEQLDALHATERSVAFWAKATPTPRT